MKPLKTILFIFVVISFSCHNKYNQPENINTNYLVTSTSQLNTEAYSLNIDKFYNSGKEGKFIGKSGIRIYYKTFRNSTGNNNAIMISSGRGESIIKYKELIFDLYNNGYSVYIHDHRGQGLSERILQNPLMGHIDTFQYFVDDMKYFYDNEVKTSGHDHIFLLAHSMGGTIGCTYIEQYPQDFSAAAFSSPMLGLKTGICFGSKILTGETVKYAPGIEEATQETFAFEGNTQTSSKIRYNRMTQAFTDNPKAKLAGPTIQWINRCCQQFDVIFNNITNIETPMTIFIAENEQIVNPNACKAFTKNAKAANKTCTLFFIKNAQHELLMEKDTPRQTTLVQTLSFFEYFTNQ
ncbi:alpha/beta fold hydrolase [Bacteroidales bacterium]|nr:alpha/beta fold hydrolase [Bacteroidales bacterium]